MANILSRFGDIISANINALLDKAEDPAKMIDQYLRKASEDLAEVKENTAAVMAEEKRCKRMLDECEAEVARYADLAKKALTAGNEDDARAFIAKKQKLEENLVVLKKNHDAACLLQIRLVWDFLQLIIRIFRKKKQGFSSNLRVICAFCPPMSRQRLPGRAFGAACLAKCLAKKEADRLRCRRISAIMTPFRKPCGPAKAAEKTEE